MRLTKTRGKGTMKGYIALFVCMGTRAVHNEAIEDLSSRPLSLPFIASPLAGDIVRNSTPTKEQISLVRMLNCVSY